jgi:hypothetical protein
MSNSVPVLADDVAADLVPGCRISTGIGPRVVELLVALGHDGVQIEQVAPS